MEVRKGEKGREGKKVRGSEQGGTSLPRVLRSKDIPKIKNFPKSRTSQNTEIPKQHSQDCHMEYSTIVLSQNTQLGLVEYELLRNSYAIPQHPLLLNKP